MTEQVKFKYNGIDIYFDLPDSATDHIQRLIYLTRSFYELPLLEDSQAYIRPQGLTIDVGAYIGNHSVFFAKVCGSRVISYEPSLRSLPILERNISINNLNSLVTIRNCAVGATHARGTVIEGPEDNHGKTTVAVSESGDQEIVTLDADVGDQKVDLIKIDAEGMELEVLQGAQAILERDRPIVYVEAAHPNRLAAVEKALARFGYMVFERFGHTPTYLFIHVKDDEARLRASINRYTEVVRGIRNLANSTAAMKREFDRQATNQATMVEAALDGLRERISADLSTTRDTLNSVAVKLEEGTAGLADQKASYFAQSLAYRGHLERILGSRSWKWSQRLRGLTLKAMGRRASPLTIGEIDKHVAAAYPVKVPRPHPRRASASPEYPPTERTGDATATKVFVGIAAIPQRKAALEKSVRSLIDQVDRIGVYLNGWEEVPSFLLHPRIEVRRSQVDGDIGDAGKFYWVENHSGYYLTCDDDLLYPPDYVARLIGKLREHDDLIVAGWHGSLVRQPFVDYYDQQSRRVFVFRAKRPWDTPAHILGTGCCAFHTATLRVRLADFPIPNMADVFLAELAQKQRVPMLIVNHAAGEVQEIAGSQEASINRDSLAQTDSLRNTRRIQTERVAKTAWRTFEWRPLSILVVGRFETYKKGGIHKSCHLIEESLKGRGHSVKTHDTSKPFDTLKGIDLAWIYPGDPDRPDFESVDTKIAELRAQGVPVLVNLSYLYLPERSAWIAKKLESYNSDKNLPPVFAAVFTESVVDDSNLQDVREYICFVPKTIDPTPACRIPSFWERSGICFGDSAKLVNERIVGGSLRPWIDAVSRRLPHVDLYAFKQYGGARTHPDLKIVPYMTDEFGNFLSSKKLFINLNIHLTFEMVACEAMTYGTPIIYRHMPHSLSEYIGPTGIRIRSPEELGEMAAWIYNDNTAWEEFHHASIAGGEAFVMKNLNAQLEASLRLCLLRMRRYS